MSDNQSIYQEMFYNSEDIGSSDDGWSDDHFSDVDSSDNEMGNDFNQRYLELNAIKYPEKISSSPALPPRINLKPLPIPPTRKKANENKTRGQNNISSEANSRQFSNKAPENLAQALSKLNPVASSYKIEERGNYITPAPVPPTRKKQVVYKQKKFTSEANSRQFSNKAPENLAQALSKLRPVTTSNRDEDYVLPLNNSRKHFKENSKISKSLTSALSKEKLRDSNEEGDYVVPVHKTTWQQSKDSLISPLTHKEMSERKKLPIPSFSNSPKEAESSYLQDSQNFEWFHSKSNREIIQEQLLQHGMDGMFAVRKSNQKRSHHSYSLTFYHKDQIYNFPIRTRESDKKFALGYKQPNEPTFSSLEKLVAYFSQNKIKLANNELAILTTPLPKFS